MVIILLLMHCDCFNHGLLHGPNNTDSQLYLEGLLRFTMFAVIKATIYCFTTTSETFILEGLALFSLKYKVRMTQVVLKMQTLCTFSNPHLGSLYQCPCAANDADHGIHNNFFYTNRKVAV